MQYTMLLWPHANARYQNEADGLARAELQLMFQRLNLCADIDPAPEGNLPSIRFSMEEPLSERHIAVLSSHSLIYALFSRAEDGALLPLCGREAPRIGGDLPGILKYKGKTNEQFTQLLINFAHLSGNMPERAKLLDPMCGRATALFVAANRGWDAVGCDIARADLREAENFLKRYLEYHRMKHRLSRGSMTLAGKKSAPYAEFEMQGQSLRLSELDAARASEAFGRGKFDLVVADLPYGVQHSAGGSLPDLLKRSLPGLRTVLKKGGAAAVSFNAQTLPSAHVRALFAGAGFEVMEGGPYDALSHWVEQAVTRDIVVGVKNT